jgi:O-antigen ligase
MKLFDLKNNLILFGLLFFFLFPMLPIALQSISYVFILLVLLLSNFNKISLNAANIKTFTFLSGFYILSIISYFWSSNTIGFIKEVSSNFLIILFPLLLLISVKLESKNIKILKFTFVGAAFILSIKILIYSSYGYMMLEHYHGNLYYYNLNIFERILKSISLGYETIYNAAQYTYPNKNGILHRNYSSTIYLISIIFIYSLLKENKKLVIKIIYILLIGYFTLNIFYYRSLINMALIIFLPFIYFFWNKGLVTLKNIIYLFILMVFAIFLFNKNILQLLERFDIERYVLYTSSFHLIKENFIFGIGVGDVFEVLNSRNQSLRELFNIQELNNHSQFLFYFIATGFLGFILFILNILKLLLSFKYDFEIICLLLIFFSNCVFENFLSRMVGVEIYLLVYLIMLFKKNQNYDN